MEKFFQPSKWFVLFCGILVFVFFALQYVANTHLEEIGKVLGAQVFTWEWPEGSGSLYSSGVVTTARVLRRSEAEALIEVTAKQRLEQRSTAGSVEPAEPESKAKSKTDQPGTAGNAPQIGGGSSKAKEAKAEAKLTLYKVDQDWRLGRVEFK